MQTTINRATITCHNGWSESYFPKQERYQTIITLFAGRLDRIEQTHAKTQTGIDDLQASINDIKILDELPPRITQYRISFYEWTVRQKIALEEQAKLKAREAENLTDKANSIKKK